jgi:large subunit ribosomal protein L4
MIHIPIPDPVTNVRTKSRTPKISKEIKVSVYNLAGKPVGEIELRSDIFGVRWNPDLVQQALLALEANRRKPLAHTKTRGEVSGGGKKPWRQKGTGRARHGSIRSPIWKGGGVSHGPRNEKDYSVRLNRKMRRLAVRSVLSKKLTDHELRVVESFALRAAKTKELSQTLTTFFTLSKPIKLPSSLLIPAPGNKNIYRAAANLPHIMSIDPTALNVRDLLRHKQILIEKAAISSIR